MVIFEDYYLDPLNDDLEEKSKEVADKLEELIDDNFSEEEIALLKDFGYIDRGYRIKIVPKT